jgi:uncharacterized protein YwlG (UPF0340 family)
MFTFPIFRRQNDRPTTRRTQPRRRPLVEALEGRQLLSSFTGTVVNTSASLVAGSHIGTNVSSIQGNHIGTNVSEIVGQHIG